MSGNLMDERLTRRRFIRSTGVAAMVAALGTSIPFARFLPEGLLPVALAQDGQNGDGFKLAGKEGLRILNSRPINAETPAHLLDDPVTPASRLFVRNNGIPPYTDDIDPMAWTLEIEGEACLRPVSMTLAELQQLFSQHRLQIQNHKLNCWCQV